MMINLNRPAIAPGPVTAADVDRNLRAAFHGAAAVTHKPLPRVKDDPLEQMDSADREVMRFLGSCVAAVLCLIAIVAGASAAARGLLPW